MSKELMSFDKFKYIMEEIISFRDKKDRIADFFEKELMEDSWCILTFGNTMEDVLISLLADEFDCWYTFREGIKEFDWWRPAEDGNRYRGFENEIADWMYTLDEKKVITINDKEIDITSLESFYDYLVSSYNAKHNLTES